MGTSTIVTTARRAARPLKRMARAGRERLAERRDPLYGMLQSATRESPGDQVWDALWDNRRRLVRELAPGRSFLDLGGMFGVHGELAFLAEEAGATRVVLFDAMDPSEEFAARHASSASKLQFFQGDLHDPALPSELGSFDVVWCSGVVYHSPNPIQQLQHIRAMTLDTLVLGSLVIPEVPGIENGCILYPGISAEMQATFKRSYGDAHVFPGMTDPFDTTPLMSYVNMWWGISPSALRSMLVHTGFDVVDEHVHSPFAIDLVARLGGVSPDQYPPLDQSRGRVRDRIDAAGGAVPDYAAEQWAGMNGGGSDGS